MTTNANSPFAPRGDKPAIEEGQLLAPKFDEHGLIPAVAVDHQTGQVLMVAYMNDQSLRKTLEIGEAVYFSRSRQKLWHKGESSQMVQKVKEILIDCDQDTLVLRVEQVGPGCCHVGYRSCFYRKVATANPAGGPMRLEFVEAEKAYDPAKVYG